MKVKEMISTLHHTVRVEFRDEDGYEICEADTDSAGMEPYLEREVSQWFPYYGRTLLQNKANFVIFLKEAADE